MEPTKRARDGDTAAPKRPKMPKTLEDAEKKREAEEKKRAEAAEAKRLGKRMSALAYVKAWKGRDKMPWR